MKTKTRKKIHKVFRFFLFCSLSFLLLLFIDKQLVPPLKELSHAQCKTTANQIIDASVKKVLSEFDLTEYPLLFHNSDGYATDTKSVNQICAAFSAEITDSMIQLPNENFEIPLGAVTKISFLANKGPNIPFTLTPVGTVKVDYESSFLSVGINQINYKIWLDISAEMKIVNPLYQECILMERKILLADIIFSGKVPEHYFQMSYPNEYLLTE